MRKRCIICGIDSITNPNVVFLHVPKDETRILWIQFSSKKIGQKSCVYCCGNHFVFHAFDVKIPNNCHNVDLNGRKEEEGSLHAYFSFHRIINKWKLTAFCLHKFSAL